MLTKQQQAEYLYQVAHPGKFEGESAFVPFLWEDSMNGCAETVDDVDDVCFTVYVLDDELRAEWPEQFAEYENGTEFWLHERDTGFVDCDALTTAQAKAMRDAIDKDWARQDDEETAIAWEVVVGNVGTVYSGTDEAKAREEYSVYCQISDSGQGRAGNESVTLLADGDIVAENGL